MQLPDHVARLVEAGALFVLNDSGGKDSQAMRIALRAVPAALKVVVHASLGDIEWPGALEHAQAGAAREGLPFVVARAGKTFFEMVERRHEARPDVPCWPSASSRQCTSDLKRDPIAREVRRLLTERGGRLVVNCMGIRADESPRRAKATTWKRSERNSLAGREWFDWLPIHALSLADVRRLVADAGEQLHPAYASGNERLSCQFCIMGSANDLRNAARQNVELYRRYVDLEAKTGYTMHQSRRRLKPTRLEQLRRELARTRERSLEALRQEARARAKFGRITTKIKRLERAIDDERRRAQQLAEDRITRAYFTD